MRLASSATAVPCSGALTRDAPSPTFQVTFAVLFVGFRTIYWPCVSYHFWADSVKALRGEAGTNAPVVHSGAAFALFLVANLGLTGLQLLWTSKILKGLKAAAGGGEGKTQKKV